MLTKHAFLADDAHAAHHDTVPGAGAPSGVKQTNADAEAAAEVAEENLSTSATNTDPEGPEVLTPAEVLTTAEVVATAAARDRMDVDSDLDMAADVQSSRGRPRGADTDAEQAICSEGGGIQTPVDAVVLSGEAETTTEYEVNTGEVTSPMGMGRILLSIFVIMETRVALARGQHVHG